MFLLCQQSLVLVHVRRLVPAVLRIGHAWHLTRGWAQGDHGWRLDVLLHVWWQVRGPLGPQANWWGARVTSMASHVGVW